MKKNDKQPGKVGAFAANSSSGDAIKGLAILSGIVTQTGKNADTLTYTLKSQ